MLLNLKKRKISLSLTALAGLFLAAVLLTVLASGSIAMLDTANAACKSALAPLWAASAMMAAPASSVLATGKKGFARRTYASDAASASAIKSSVRVISTSWAFQNQLYLMLDMDYLHCKI